MQLECLDAVDTQMFDLYLFMCKYLKINDVAFVAHLKNYILGCYMMWNCWKIRNFATEKEKDCNLL